jgi:hypothetical protein
MPDADATLLQQALAVLATGTAGCCLLRIAAAARARVFGVGLLVAAALAAVDTMPLAGHGLPLAGCSLFVFALLAAGPRTSGLAAAIAATPLRLATLGVAIALLLHQAHRAMPLQPGFELGTVCYPLDLACALGLAWLAATRRELAFALRVALGAGAAGLAYTSFTGEQGMPLAASMQAAGCAGILWRGLVQARRCLAISLASTFAIALACALRANAERHGAPSSFAGLDDPLLVLAALFAAFGAALHRVHVAVAAQTAAPAKPATPPSAPDVAPAPLQAPTPEPEPAQQSSDLVDLPDENDAMRARAEAEHTLSEVFSLDEAHAPEPVEATQPTQVGETRAPERVEAPQPAHSDAH